MPPGFGFPVDLFYLGVLSLEKLVSKLRFLLERGLQVGLFLIIGLE